ncbi:MAG TPA: YiiX family permuted papain-like enzyme [Thermoanaerobaculia bacterium]|nr:YiiX family permuted papain-like enzyme [Thermoanaerobaculia bacterium]
MRRLLLAFLVVLSCGVAHGLPVVQDGDIIFQTSRSSQSVAVQRATGSPFSHMGLILFQHGKPYVFEAIARVQYTPLDRWIARGIGGHFVVKRLKNAARALDAQAVQKLRAATVQFQGRPYDLTFEWSDDRVYCSELVWKLYDRALGVRIGELQHIKDFNLKDPSVRAKLRERYGDHVPIEEPVISPDAMFRSPLLVTVAENKKRS